MDILNTKNKMKKNYFLALILAIFAFVNANSQLTAPFTESFNSTTFPSTWNLAAKTGGPWTLTGTMGYAAAPIIDHTGIAGSTRAWMDFSGADDSVVMTSDTIDVSALTSPELNFWFNNDLGTNSITPLNLLYIEAMDTSGNWDILDSLQQDNMGVWSEHYYILTAKYLMPGSKVLVRFRVESGGASADYFHDLAIDDISVREFTPCRMPVALTADSITTSSALLRWLASSTDTAWRVEWDTLGFTQGTGTMVSAAGDSTFLTGLNHSTDYSFYVQGFCSGGDTSQWAGPFSFKTLCLADTIPYLMDFDTWPPACWDMSLGVNPWLSYAGTSGHAEADFWSKSTGDYIMTSVPVYSDKHTRVKFDWSHLYSATYPDDSLRVLVKLDTDTTWEVIWSSNLLTQFNSNDGAGNTNPGSFKTESIILDSNKYKNKNIMVRFQAFTDFGPDLFIDNVIIEEIPSCPEPTLLAHYALFYDSVALSWTNGLADSIWQVEYGTAGFTQGTGTLITDNNDSIAFGGLTPSTTYDVYLRSICKVGDSSVWIGPYTFTTPCSFYTPPYSEDYSTYSFSVLPTCWEEATGQLTVSSSLTFGTSNWTNRGSFANNGLGNNSAVMNIYATGRYEWLISPSIDLGTGTIPYQVEFDVAITDYFNATAPTAAGGLMGPDDKLVLVISPDNGVTWSDTNILVQWDTSNMPSFTGDFFAFNLTAAGYTGQVKFGLYAESTLFNEDNDAFVDNFAVVQVPTCPRPLGLTFDSATLTTADMSWTNGAADSIWLLEYGPVGFTQGTGTTFTSTTSPGTITGLTHSTCYDVYLRSVCTVGDSSKWIGPTRVCTDCAPVVDLCEDFEAANAGELPICWERFVATTGSSSVQVNNFGGNIAPKTVQLNAGNDAASTLMLITPEMTALTAGTHRAVFWLDGSFTPDTSIIIGTITDPTNPATFTPWDTITTITNSYQEFRIPFDTYTGTDNRIAFLYNPTSTFRSINIDDFCFEPIPSCEKAPSVQILNSGVDSTSINVGWNIDTTHVSYMVAYGPAGYDPVTNTAGGDTTTSTTNFKNVSGLQPLTEYCFWVKAICTNGDTSFWDGPHCGFTGCPSSTPVPYSEDFTSYQSNFPNDIMPQCWEEAKGPLTATGTALAMGTSNWTPDGFANVGTDGSAKMNIYSTGRQEWIISPSINLGSDPNQTHIIEFDIAMTDYANTTPGVCGVDDSLAFVISYDNGVTWNHAGIIEVWDTSNVPSSTGDHFYYILRNETGIVRFGFYAASSVSNEDNDWFIDNFSIKDTVFVGLDEVSEVTNFKIFPNPNTGIFTILNEGGANQTSVKVLDVQGRLVFDEAYYFNENARKVIDIHNLNAGVYVLLLQSEGKLEQHRIIISK